jgi:hypothetical protein
MLDVSFNSPGLDAVHQCSAGGCFIQGYCRFRWGAFTGHKRISIQSTAWAWNHEIMKSITRAAGQCPAALIADLSLPMIQHDCK